MRVFVCARESLVKARRECQLNWPWLGRGCEGGVGLCVGVHAYMRTLSNYEDWHWSLVGAMMKKTPFTPLHPSPSSLLNPNVLFIRR